MVRVRIARAVALVCLVACGGRHGASASADAGLELAECAAYAAAFARCAAASGGQAALLPHPTFQPAFHDEASKEIVRQQCRTASKRTEESCR